MPPNTRTRSARWTRTLHQWHWVSSALCLAGLLLFALTGITLNHAGEISAAPRVSRLAGQLPPEFRQALPADGQTAAPLPSSLRAWLDASLGISVGDREAEWSVDEIYLSLPRPGGDAWLRIDRESGAVEYESTERGWIAYLNDLHKGRHAGLAWRWFIDLFAAACGIFSLTGLLLLHRHGGNRPATWPTVALGIALPGLLAFLVLH